MIRSPHLKLLSLIVFFGFYAFLNSDVYAQVSFVQISDPHIFDDTRDQTDNRWNNKAAFILFIDRINQQLLDNKANYKFVVVTGDLGLDKLIAGIADQNEIQSSIRNGAAEFGSMLVLSKVRHWLFVPGNNDLLNEEPKNIEYYHLFIQALREATNKTAKDFEIHDLCPKAESDSGSYQSRSDFFKIKQYAFIGFDNSSFKNSDENVDKTNQGRKRRIEFNADIQEKYAKQVRVHLDREDISYAYVFYHIPGIDDPHLISQNPTTKM